MVLKKGVVTLCDRPVAYNYFLKLLKTEASLAHLSCVNLKEKLGLHSLRRGPVTKAVNAGTSDYRVQKMMHVSSLNMVDHYSMTDHKFLFQTSKSAFYQVLIFLKIIFHPFLTSLKIKNS